MKKPDFLKQLKKEGKLSVVERSEEMKESYLKKAEDCLKSAKILFKNGLYDNSISEAYYCMYNSLLALLFKAGIKSENHSGSIILLKDAFREDALYEMISIAKKERIDRQYYIESKTGKTSKGSCDKMIKDAEDFSIRIRLLMNRLNSEEINKIRGYLAGK